MTEPARLLIVEDDPHLLHATARLLEKAGHQVAQAAQGSEALRLAQAQHPDLILLDTVLPDIDGLEVCRRIKADPALDACFVVLLTGARTSSDDQVTGLEAGADGTIGWPISNRELLARVEAVLRTHRAEARVAHLNQVLRAIRNVNQLIVREKDRDQLVQGACENLIETRGYFDAWIAVVDQDGNLETAAATGIGDERAALLERLQQGVFPSCVQRAVERTSLVTSDDPAVDCADCVLAESAPTRLGIAVPLEYRDRIHGVLVVSVPTHLSMHEQERALLREVAGDIAFALRNIELEGRREQAEQDLRASEERYKSLYTSMAEGLCLHELVYDDSGAVVDYRILDANPNYERITGLEMQKVIQQLASDVYGAGAPPYLDIYARVAQTGQATQFETHFPPMDKHFHISVFSPGKDQFATVFQDITARKQAEEALRESQRQLATLMSNLRGMAYRCKNDADWTLEFISAGCQPLTGYRPEELAGNARLSFSDLILPADRQAVRDGVQAALEKKTPFELTYRIVTASGEEKWVWEQGRGVLGPDGDLLALEGFITDITERKAAETALRDSEARYRTLAESSHDLIWEIDAQGCLTFINAVAKEIYGYEPKEMIGSEFLRLIVPEDRENAIRAFEAALVGGRQVLHYQTRELTKNGEVVILDVHTVVRRDAQGNFLGMSGTSQDITERTRAEEALRESENQHRTLFETTTQGVMYMDEKGQIVTANPAAERILGLSLEQMQGRTSMDPGWHAIHEDGSDFPGETHPSAVALHTGHEVRNVVMGIFHPPSGNYRWLNVHAVPQFRPGEDRPYQIYTTFDDITAQKHATQERERLLAQIRGQARQMAQVLAAVPEGVLLLDSTGRVLQANPAAERDLADLANVQVGDTLTHLGDRPLADILASPRTRGLWHEVRVDQRTFEVISRPVENGAEPERWVLVVSDVTRERQVRTQLQQQERLVAVGQLAAGIAHDFNNIIGTIILYARLVEQSEALSERNRERLGLVGQQAWHATRLIEQILDFSRRSVLERRPLDLLPLLKEQKKLLERTLPENIRIELSYGQKEYTVNADPTRMQQMLTNLAVNARDAMQRGGTFRIELAREIIQPGDSPLLTPMKPGEWIRLKVSDTGTGIPPEVLPHIFEPFFTTKEPGEGTGLGLAQVHGIVGQHEGHIGIETRVGEGSTFTIYLPALEVRPARRPSQNIAAAPKGHGQLLLVVEDEPTLRDAMNQVLTLLNYRTLEAKDGQDALELMHEQGDQVALVLSDVVMPVMGGIALFHALREQGWTTPMILLTGHPMDKELDALSELGLTAWMTKPPSLERLATAIDTALGEESGVGA